MNNKPRERCTNATRQRVDNIKRLIDNLREVGRMPRDDIFFFLSMSPSGGRKYIQQLADDAVVVIVDFEADQPKTRARMPIYALNPRPGLVEEFLRTLDEMPKNLTQRRAMVDHTGTVPRMQKVQAENGRQVHMLRDDVEHKPRSVKFRIPAPDPVLAALFGLAAPATAESLL